MPNRDVYCERILYWLLNPAYSKQHWEAVAIEIRDRCDSDMNRAVVELAYQIRNFHIKFQDAVVKPGNVLYDLIDLIFVEADFEAVAKLYYAQLEDKS